MTDNFSKQKEIANKLDQIIINTTPSLIAAYKSNNYALVSSMSSQIHTNYTTSVMNYTAQYDTFITAQNIEKKRHFANTAYYQASQGNNAMMKRTLGGNKQLVPLLNWLKQQQSNNKSSAPTPMTNCCCGSSCGLCVGGDICCCCDCGSCGCNGDNCCGCGNPVYNNLCLNTSFYILGLDDTAGNMVLKVSFGYCQYVPYGQMSFLQALLWWATYYLTNSPMTVVSVSPINPNFSNSLPGTFILTNCYFWGSDVYSWGSQGSNPAAPLEAFSSYAIISCSSMFNTGRYPSGMS